MDESKKFQPSIGEVIENLDPVLMAEQALGKSWDDMSDDEKGDALRAIASFNGFKRAVAEKVGDTHLSSPIELTESILIENGFQIGYRQSRDSANTGRRETETIWCRPDGVVVYVDTYGGTRINHVEMVAEIKRGADDETFNVQYQNASRLVCGGGTYGLFPYGWDTPMEQKNIAVKADVRDGLRWKLKALGEIGTTFPVWQDTEKFVWFINHDEEHGCQDRAREIFKEKVLQGTPMLKNIMANMLK